MKNYNVSIGSCANTTTPTKILEVNIPSNDWQDGERITVDVIASGASNLATLNLDLSYGASAVNNISDSMNALGVSRLAIELWRVGSSIYVNKQNVTSDGATGGMSFNSIGDGMSYTGADGAILTGVSFTSKKTLAITATYNVADAGDSIEILAAKVVKI